MKKQTKNKSRVSKEIIWWTRSSIYEHLYCVSLSKAIKCSK